MESAAASGRRQLQFESWSSIESDIQDLLHGYDQHGNWNLAQAALHLKDWLSFPMDGFPKAPLPVGILLFVMRVTVGKKLLRSTLADRKMPDGGPTSPETVHSDLEVDEHAAAEQLLAMIRRFQEFDGPIQRSPVFGDMDKKTAEQLQFVHFAHHLSWLTPSSGS